jgi:hypothetical protein
LLLKRRLCEACLLLIQWRTSADKTTRHG